HTDHPGGLSIMLTQRPVGSRNVPSPRTRHVFSPLIDSVRRLINQYPEHGAQSCAALGDTPSSRFESLEERRMLAWAGMVNGAVIVRGDLFEANAVTVSQASGDRIDVD